MEPGLHITARVQSREFESIEVVPHPEGFALRVDGYPGEVFQTFDQLWVYVRNNFTELREV